eukprot:5846541-Amphidinium_carterae.1
MASQACANVCGCASCSNQPGAWARPTPRRFASKTSLALKNRSNYSPNNKYYSNNSKNFFAPTTTAGALSKVPAALPRGTFGPPWVARKAASHTTWLWKGFTEFG